MRITAEVVRHLSELARLDLAPDEVERMRCDLDAVLEYVETLDQLDTSDVEPMAYLLDAETPLRADTVAGVLPVEEALRNAPLHDDASMVVPKVIG